MFVLGSCSVRLLPPIPRARFVYFVAPPLGGDAGVGRSSVRSVVLFCVFFSRVAGDGEGRSFLAFGSVSYFCVFRCFLRFVSGRIHTTHRLGSFLQVRSITILRAARLPPGCRSSVDRCLHSSKFSCDLPRTLRRSPPKFLRSLFQAWCDGPARGLLLYELYTLLSLPCEF